MNKETGVPAFPIDAELCQDLTIEEQRGMKLRDYLAAKAMEGVIAATPAQLQIDEPHLAKWSYKMADAMLEARK